jgi:hypothetical protein
MLMAGVTTHKNLVTGYSGNLVVPDGYLNLVVPDAPPTRGVTDAFSGIYSGPCGTLQHLRSGSD